MKDAEVDAKCKCDDDCGYYYDCDVHYDHNYDNVFGTITQTTASASTTTSTTATVGTTTATNAPASMRATSSAFGDGFHCGYDYEHNYDTANEQHHDCGRHAKYDVVPNCDYNQGCSYCTTNATVRQYVDGCYVTCQTAITTVQQLVSGFRTFSRGVFHPAVEHETLRC